jgi:hypothetical protein
MNPTFTKATPSGVDAIRFNDEGDIVKSNHLWHTKSADFIFKDKDGVFWFGTLTLSSVSLAIYSHISL